MAAKIAGERLVIAGKRNMAFVFSGLGILKVGTSQARGSRYTSIRV